MVEIEKEEEKKIKLPICYLDSEKGEVVCRVREEIYEKIKKSKPVRRITFELEEK